MTRLAKNFASVCVLTMLLCVPGLQAEADAAQKYPSKTIEIICPTSPGGGSDIFARTMAKIITDKKLSPHPVVVINKPGGSSAIGFAYISKQTKNPYVLGIINSSYYTVPLAGKSPVSYRNFEHIALMCQDPMFVVASKDAPYKTLKELIAYATTGGNKVISGGTSTTSEDALTHYAMKDQTKMNMDYVPFNSSGEVLTALLGKHIALGFLGPSEAQTQIESGDIIVLATTTGARLAGYPNVPTLKEEGINIELCQNRGVIAPEGIDKEAVAFLENMFKQLSETEEWKDFLKKNDMVPKYLNAADFSKATVEISNVYETYRKLVK